MNGQFWHRNASTVLTCLGGAGVIITSVMAAKATPKALENLEEAKQEKGEELSKWEKVKVAGPKYLPTIVIGGVTVVCIFGANILNKRQQANLASAYALIDQSYKRYQNKVKEIYGEDAHEEILELIAAEKSENVGIKSPGFVSNDKLYVDNQCGETRIFYDEFGDRFFEATLEQVISAQYHLNRNYTLRGYTVLNEFYDFLGIEPTGYGNELGWIANDDGKYWIEFNNKKVNIRGVDCIIIEMPFAPDLEWQEEY